MNAEIRIGTVSDVNAEARQVRVLFADDGIVSDWLSVLDNTPTVTNNAVDGTTTVGGALTTGYAPDMTTGGAGYGATGTAGGGSTGATQDLTPTDGSQFASHTHTLAGHTHEVQSHTHHLPNHTHTGPAHSHMFTVTSNVAVNKWMPGVGETVLCLFDGGFNGAGYVVAGF